MTDAEIADAVAAFASAAADAKAIGFDAVELHGAHGYLIDQSSGRAPTSAPTCSAGRPWASAPTSRPRS
jgi:hypothetical protein